MIPNEFKKVFNHSVGAPFMAPETNGPHKCGPYRRTVSVNKILKCLKKIITII